MEGEKNWEELTSFSLISESWLVINLILSRKCWIALPH